MRFLSAWSDNITELLVKIIKFTRLRKDVLKQNITGFRNPGFVPTDLSVGKFSELLNKALDEHICNRRLVLQDSKHLKFGINGAFQAEPVVDECAKALLQENHNKYLELQINKLFENTLNHRVALELLRKKQGRGSILDFYSGRISEKFYQ